MFKRNLKIVQELSKENLERLRTKLRDMNEENIIVEKKGRDRYKTPKEKNKFIYDAKVCLA